MTEARLELDNYTMRVLDVVKGKFGLKNRSDALKKIALEIGPNYIEPEPNVRYLKELDAEYAEHKKKYGHKSMSEKELNKLLALDE